MGRSYLVTPALLRKERIIAERRLDGTLCGGGDTFPGCTRAAAYTVTTTEASGYVGQPMQLCGQHAAILRRSLAYYGRTNSSGQTFGPITRIGG
jgi:hypothetical protein